MPLQRIEIPNDIQKLNHSVAAEDLIEEATERIEAFMLSRDSISENFVRCDFHLVDQSLTWIKQNQLLAGRRFCELGSGFGVAALLASQHGLQSVGIEIEDYLVDEAMDLAESQNLPTEFYCGSFIPRGLEGIVELGGEVEHVETHEDDVYDEIELGMDDFDLFFAFPWPGEEHFFEAVFESAAADQSMLLTFRGRDEMHLVRKV